MKQVFVCLLLCLPALVIRADEIPMHALVIGNNAYLEGPLKNPVNDARLIADTLAPIGFKVTTKTDLNQEQMDQAVSEFTARLPRGSVALFFYAGHGVQDRNKRNFLVPVDAKLQNEASIRYRTLSLDYVVDAMEQSRSNLNVVVLDCCRDNPFERSWARGLDARGLAVIEAPEGTIIAHSTASGATAADGDGENSPYTKQLARAFSQGSTEKLPLVNIFRRASRAVLEETQQRPFLEFDASMPEFHLFGGPIAKTPDVGAPSPAATPMLPTEHSTPSSASSTPGPPAGENALLQQAAIFGRNGEHDLAIEAYTALIATPNLPPSVRTEARRGRGAAYLARRSSIQDINLALIDHKAVGAKGVHLSVLAEEAELKNGAQVAGIARRNEVLFVTDSQGRWSLVESVGGNDQRRGWVDLSALVQSKRAAQGVPAQGGPPTTAEMAKAGHRPDRDPPPSTDHTSDDVDAQMKAMLAALPKNQLRLGVFMDATLLGAVVVAVVPDSPATKCHSVANEANDYSQPGRFSLKRDDLIVAINNTPVQDAAEALKLIATAPRQIRLKMVRNSGPPFHVVTQLLHEPKQLPPPPPIRHGIAQATLQSIGITAVNTDASAGGIQGLRVTSVRAGSLAATITAKGNDFDTHITAGDVITNMNFFRIKTIADADRAISTDSVKGGWQLRMRLIDAQQRPFGIRFIYK